MKKSVSSLKRWDMGSDIWPKVRLGNHCLKIGSGATPTGGRESYLNDGPVKLIRSQNVYNHGFDKNGLAFISYDQASKLDGVSVEENDILLNITGDSVARVCLAPKAALPARVNQHVAIIRPIPEEFDSRFLRYFLISPSQQSLLLGLAAAGATRNALTKVMIENLEVPKPSLSEQKVIADILSILDERIELNQLINDTHEGIAQALFKSWFVDFDPVKAKVKGREPAGMDDITAALFPSNFTDSILGNIPFGWKVASLADICKNIFSGGTPSTQMANYWNGNIPWLSSGETRNRFIIDTEKTITEEGITNSSTRLARHGCTVIAGAGQGHTRGQTSLLILDSYINQSVVALKANPKFASDLFLFFDLMRRYEEFRQLSDSHSSRGSLTTKLLSGVKIVLPPAELIQKFDDVASPLVNKIVANLQNSRTLANLRDVLLPRLISGKLRIIELPKEADAS